MTRLNEGARMKALCLVVLVLCVNLAGAAQQALLEDCQAIVPGKQLVMQLQVALSGQHLYQGEIDGLIGAQTQEALYLLQMAHELPLTGSVNLPTLKALSIVPPHWMQH